MQLELGSGERLANVTPSQLTEALASLDGGPDSFAILSRNEMTYVQASGGCASGYLLEYQLGSTSAHFRSVRDDHPQELLERVFQSYLAGQSSWQGLLPWEEDAHQSGGISFGAIFALAGMIALVLSWLATR